MQTSDRAYAVVTGASSGIGRELAQQFAEHGYDLLVVAEDDAIETAASELATAGTEVQPLRADLSTEAGVSTLIDAVRARGAVDALVVNAGIGTSGAFVDADLRSHLTLIDLNIRGAVQLVHEVLPMMIARGEGGVLFTSSIAATMPGPYASTYNASKSFVHSFAEALRVELAEQGVSVTALMPGPTDTEFFARAGLEDTKLGQQQKDDPADVARDGYDAFVAGKDHVVAGSVKNKAQAAAAKVLPDTAKAAFHGSMSKPGSGD